jgi:CubicO group peptidase (beta-lactamase class C family)
LADAVEFAAATNAQALVMLSGGRILTEWYETDKGYVRDVASVQKSVVSLLVGRAAHEGLLGLDDPVSRYLGKGWTAERAESDVTVRHLLSMTSGLDRLLRRQTAPGSEWAYNTAAYQQLHPLLEAAAGRPVDDVAREWLFDPIGAASCRLTPRRAGVAGGEPTMGLSATARDLARVGLLVLRGGFWGSDAVYPAPDHLDLALQPSSDGNPSYGLLWWLNGQDRHAVPGGPLRPGPLMPSAPADLVAGLGAQDQKLYVCPSLDLVVTRLGDQAKEERSALSDFDDQFWAALMAARLR